MSCQLRDVCAMSNMDTSPLLRDAGVSIAVDLVRHRVANLSLDALPITVHTTASDALSAGLPGADLRGAAVCGTGGGELLHAVGLPALVTTTLNEYEALALACDPSKLIALR